MKKTILTVTILLVGLTASAQKGFHLTFGGGPTFKTAEESLSYKNPNKGSFGEGLQTQFRGGYFFSDRIGVELSVGALIGNKQVIHDEDNNIITGKSRAFGGSFTGIFNITKGLYLRGGVLTKLGGKTIVEGSLNNGAIKFERENTGILPIGYTGSLGYRHHIGNNLSIFAEVEYQGISVTGDKSKFVRGEMFGTEVNSFNEAKAVVGKYVSTLPATHQQAAGAKLAAVLPYFADEITYKENPNPAKAESHASDAPYSSIGVVFGVTYHFGSCKK